MYVSRRKWKTSCNLTNGIYIWTFGCIYTLILMIFTSFRLKFIWYDICLKTHLTLVMRQRVYGSNTYIIYMYHGISLAYSNLCVLKTKCICVLLYAKLRKLGDSPIYHIFQERSHFKPHKILNSMNKICSIQSYISMYNSVTTQAKLVPPITIAMKAIRILKSTSAKC